MIAQAREGARATFANHARTDSLRAAGFEVGRFQLRTPHRKNSAERVEGEINPTKNEASEGALPLDPDLAEVLLAHKAQCSYAANSDYVFAGSTGKPRWPDTILADHLGPAAVKAGIGNIGWHTFSYVASLIML
jgi:hypothetical protein